MAATKAGIKDPKGRCWSRFPSYSREEHFPMCRFAGTSDLKVGPVEEGG
jgi:hypothetical protein